MKSKKVPLQVSIVLTSIYIYLCCASKQHDHADKTNTPPLWSCSTVHALHYHVVLSGSPAIWSWGIEKHTHWFSTSWAFSSCCGLHCVTTTSKAHASFLVLETSSWFPPMPNSNDKRWKKMSERQCGSFLWSWKFKSVSIFLLAQQEMNNLETV